MSLYIDLHVNDDHLQTVAVTRTTSLGLASGADIGESISGDDMVNTYRWVYYRDGGKQTIGHVEHRYGDGATSLAAKVLTAIAEHQAV